MSQGKESESHWTCGTLRVLLDEMEISWYSGRPTSWWGRSLWREPQQSTKDWAPGLLTWTEAECEELESQRIQYPGSQEVGVSGRKVLWASVLRGVFLAMGRPAAPTLPLHLVSLFERGGVGSSFPLLFSSAFTIPFFSPIPHPNFKVYFCNKVYCLKKYSFSQLNRIRKS